MPQAPADAEIDQVFNETYGNAALGRASNWVLPNATPASEFDEDDYMAFLTENSAAYSELLSSAIERLGQKV